MQMACPAAALGKLAQYAALGGSGCDGSVFCRAARASHDPQLIALAWTARRSNDTPTAPVRPKNGPQAIGKSRGGWNTKGKQACQM